MLPNGGMPEDVSYVLLDAPVIPPLDLSDCRPTQLPVLPTPTHQVGSTPQRDDSLPGGAAVRTGTGTGKEDPDPGPGPGPGPDVAPAMHVLPPDFVKVPFQPKVTEVRTLVVDMGDLDKYGADSSNRTQDSSSRTQDSSSRSRDNTSEGDNLQQGAKRVGGVLKGGGEYVSSGVQRPRPRVSFLLDAFPGEGQEGSGMQIRVYAKPPEGQETDPDLQDHLFMSSNGHAHPHAAVNYSLKSVNHQRVDPALPNGLSAKRVRPLGATDRRQSASSYRQQLRQWQTEARLNEAYPGAPRSADTATRMRRYLHDHPPSTTPNLPHVPHPHPHQRPPIFSLKRRTSNADSAYKHTTSGREGRGRWSFTLPPNAGNKPVKGQVRFQEAGEEDDLLGHKPHSADLLRHAGESDSEHGRALGMYSASDHPPRAVSSSKPPLPRPAPVLHTASVVDVTNGPGSGHINSPSSRSGRVTEWLSVDSIPASSMKNKPRPSTVSSTSRSSRSRDITSANHRLSGSSSSRASSASLKTASVTGPDLDNMDLVTVNLMAQRAKGPSRYRYLAKLRSLSLNTPSGLDC